MPTIKQLTPANLPQAYPIINQLRPHLTQEEYLKITNQMIKKGYQIACLYENNQIAAYAGYEKQLNLYYGHHIWVYDLITDQSKRSKGYGKMLLDYIEAYAKTENLSCIALSSGVQREAAHRFYEEKANYQKVSYVYKKDL